MNKADAESRYSIPLRYRKMENLHIVFWLFKDLAWCLSLEVVGMAMIAPTFIFSLLILWRTRKIVSELCHNLAVSVWIVANSYWMVAEFTGIDEMPLTGKWQMKHLAVIPFVIGLMAVGYYYLYYQWARRQSSSLQTQDQRG